MICADGLQDNGSLGWEPPEGLDTDLEVRRDLEDMFEETQILMDQHKTPKQGELVYFFIK